MLMNSFFLANSYAPGYEPGTVFVNLTGAASYTEDTVFKPGRYRIQVAPGSGTDGTAYSNYGAYLDFTENITQEFIVRAYCGSDAVNKTTGGTNPYSGPYKVNAINALTMGSNPPKGISVSHIFGAGGGCYYYNTPSGEYFPKTQWIGGGANSLGNGTCVKHTDDRSSNNKDTWFALGAGSCLHLLPVGGTFGNDYIRAYHAAPGMFTIANGSSYGGAWGYNPYKEYPGLLQTAGGDTPYGTNGYSGNILIPELEPGKESTGVGRATAYGANGAYFDGQTWQDVPSQVGENPQHSLIKITYLGEIKQ